MLKLSENPPALWPEGIQLESIAGQWYVAHTKARCEKAFAQDLLAREVPYFLPMIPQVRVSGGRRRTVLLPLFTGYVFFAGSSETRYQALCTGRLNGVINAPDQPRLAQELSAIHRLLVHGRSPVDLYAFAAEGTAVRIVTGALQGIRGVVVGRSDGKACLVLQVSILGQAVAVEIDAGMLEPA